MKLKEIVKRATNKAKFIYGNKKDELSLSERTYVCQKCGLRIDRDYNSSLNLRNYTASFAGIQVCGESVNLASVSG